MSLVDDRAFTFAAAFQNLRPKLVVCNNVQGKSHGMIATEVAHWDIEELVDSWQSISDRPLDWMRVEGVIFGKKRGHYILLKFL